MNSSLPKVWLIGPPSSLEINTSFANMDELFNSFGFSRMKSILYLSLFIECASVGFLLNLFSLWIFMRSRKFNQPIYFYLKVLTFTSMLANFLQILFAIGMSRRLHTFGDSIHWQYFFAYVYSPLHNTLTFYKFIMDAVIIVDRISTINPKVKACMKQRPCFKSIVGFLIATVLASPQFLLYSPYEFNIFDEETGETARFYTTDVSLFARDPHGSLLISLVTVFRSLVLCAIDLALNIVSFFKFKNYFLKKNRLTNTAAASSAGGVLSPKRSEHLDDLAINTEDSATRAASERSIGPGHMRYRSTHVKNTIVEKSLTKMCIVMCTISIAHQIVYVTNTFTMLSLGGVRPKSAVSIFASEIASVLRHSSNFFIFYSFNKNFKLVFRTFFSK
jgi:hypothetical protein